MRLRRRRLPGKASLPEMREVLRDIQILSARRETGVKAKDFRIAVAPTGDERSRIKGHFDLIGRLPALTPEREKWNARVGPIPAAAGRCRKRPITSARFDPPCTAPRIPCAPPAASTAIDSHQPADVPPRPPDHPNH